MGYSLKIGELVQTTEIGDDGIPYLYNDVELVKHDHLPMYDEPTDQENQRWPSYTAWSDFSKFVGLHDFFFNEETGLLREHPGCVRINSDHLSEIELAYQKFMRKYPNAVAGYSTKIDHPKGIHEDPEWPEENSFLVRLEWLKYWTKWAIENCKNPVFSNK